MTFPLPLVPLSGRRLIAIVLAVLLAALVAAGVSTTAGGGISAQQAAQASPPALTPALADLAERDPDRTIRVIVQVAPGAASAVRDAVAAIDGRVERSIELIGGLAVRVTAGGAALLAGQPGVEAVSLDAAVASTGIPDPGSLATAYNQSIRSDVAWSRGLTGRGVGVAVIDTGIRGDLADFRVSESDGTSRVVANAVVNPGAGSGDDHFGHGTHIAGLIAGNGTNLPADDPLRGRYAGVAPEADLVAVKVDDDQGAATVLDVIDGLQFVTDFGQQLGIRVVNLSLTSTVAESHLTDPLDAAVESVWKKGYVVVAAAGNRGDAHDAVSYAPANDPWIITVGGVDDRGTKAIGDDLLAEWSSRGTTQDGHVKPDVLAPGARMVSTIPAGSAYTEMCPSCVTDGRYFRVGGTSMAAAVVSGAAAVILQAHPHWTPDQVKAALVRKSRPVEDQNLADGVVVDARGRQQPSGVTVETTVTGGEVAVDKVLNGYSAVDPPAANADLPTNTYVDPVTGDIDYTRTSWTRTSWTDAVEPLRTSWTRTSWTRTSWTRTSWTATEQSCTDFERTSWTRTSWTSEDLEWARQQCSDLLASIDPTRTSWTRTSWTRTSWTSSFDK